MLPPITYNLSTTEESENESQMSDRRVELADIETVKSCVKDLRNTFEDTSINKSECL
ncbi:MAG: hypothetical protein Q7J06_02685 [Bacteroidales bacterium]|nr:hypothetical protein [Bacteroidales bacterium]